MPVTFYVYRRDVESHSHSETVAAPLTVCFATAVDFERYPEWFSTITEARIIEADQSAGLWTVALGLNMAIKTISYTLCYRAEEPDCLVWKLSGGDIKAIEGSYRFEDLGNNTTRATCRQAIDLGFWVPGPLRRSIERTALAESVREFKAAAESRAALL